MYITLPERRLIYDIRAAEKLSHSNIGKEFRIFQHDLSGIFKKGYVKYKERLTGKFNMVNYFELYYLEAGIRYHVVEDTVYCLYPGDYILYPPYVMHRSYSGEDSYFKRIVLYFTKAVVPDSQIFSLLSKRTWLYRQDAGEAVVGLLHELMAEQDKGDMYSAKYCYFLLNQLLIKLARNVGETQMSEGRTRITNVVRHLHENYADKISLDELSTRFYVSQYYLCHEFKRYTNCTIIQYVNSLRVSHAQRLLEGTDKSITEISSLVGFSNVTHFNRVFRSLTGKSPTQSRKMLRTELKN